MPRFKQAERSYLRSIAAPRAAGAAAANVRTFSRAESAQLRVRPTGERCAVQRTERPCFDRRRQSATTGKPRSNHPLLSPAPPGSTPPQPPSSSSSPPAPPAPEVAPGPALELPPTPAPPAPPEPVGSGRPTV